MRVQIALLTITLDDGEGVPEPEPRSRPRLVVDEHGRPVAARPLVKCGTTLVLAKQVGK